MKNIEWLKEKVEKRINTIESDDISFVGSEYYDEGYIDGMRDVLYRINQLDEPEVLSEEFINEKAVEVYADTADAEVHAVFRMRDLQNLLVPKQEITIGKEDAENIVQYKEMGWTLSHLINDYGEDARHDELLAKAWLAYPNIEVEEEQKYRVLDGNTTLLGRINGLMLTTVEILEYYPEYAPTFDLTEQEIKDYDPRYMTFAKPVEELEE